MQAYIIIVLEAVRVGTDIDLNTAGHPLDTQRVFCGWYLAFEGCIAEERANGGRVLVRAWMLDIGAHVIRVLPRTLSSHRFRSSFRSSVAPASGGGLAFWVIKTGCL